MQTRVQVINQTPNEHDEGYWQLRLQWCRYIFADGGLQYGYRFIWARPDGRLQPARGQARIPSRKVVDELFAVAVAEGWGGYDADAMVEIGRN